MNDIHTSDKNVSPKNSNLTNNLTLREAARYWHSQGWDVIPVDQQKRPLVKWGQWILRRQTLEELEALPWESAVGVAGITGKIYSVIDLDDNKPGEYDKAAEFLLLGPPELYNTRLHRTLHGGTHAIYKSIKPPASTDKLKKDFNVEIQGIGNYVVLPPSFNGAYKIVNPETPIREIEDLEALVFQRAKELGWNPPVEEKTVPLSLPAGVDPWSIKCARATRDHPLQPDHRHMTLGKNFAIWAEAIGLAREERRAFFQTLAQNQPDFSWEEFEGWVPWVARAPRKFNCGEVSKYLRKHIKGFTCRGCFLLKRKGMVFESMANPDAVALIEKYQDITWGNMLEMFDDVFHPSLRPALEIVGTIIIANHLGRKPKWLWIVGPPSTFKSEVIMLLLPFDGKQVYLTSVPSLNALVSGSADEPFDLLPMLNGKIWLTPELAPLLSKPYREAVKILGDLTDAYDGKFSKHSPGRGRVGYHSKFGWLGACTHENLQRHWKLITHLGNRFLLFEMPLLTEEEYRELSRRPPEEIEKKLTNLSAAFCAYLLRKLEEEPAVEMSEEARNAVERLAVFSATLRDEAPPRSLQLFHDLWVARTHLVGGDDGNLSILANIAINTTARTPALILKYVVGNLEKVKNEGVTAEELGKALGLSPDYILRVCNGLVKKGILKLCRAIEALDDQAMKARGIDDQEYLYFPAEAWNDVWEVLAQPTGVSQRFHVSKQDPPRARPQLAGEHKPPLKDPNFEPKSEKTPQKGDFEGGTLTPANSGRALEKRGSKRLLLEKLENVVGQHPQGVGWLRAAELAGIPVDDIEAARGIIMELVASSKKIVWGQSMEVLKPVQGLERA